MERVGRTKSGGHIVEEKGQGTMKGEGTSDNETGKERPSEDLEQDKVERGKMFDRG